MGRQQVVDTQLLIRLREAIINFSGQIKGLSPEEQRYKRHCLLAQVELDMETAKNCVSILGQWRVFRALCSAGLQIQGAWSSNYLPDDREKVFGHITVPDAEAFLKAQLPTSKHKIALAGRRQKQPTQKVSEHDPKQGRQNHIDSLPPGTVVVTLNSELDECAKRNFQQSNGLLKELARNFLDKGCDRWGIAFGLGCFARRKTPFHVEKVRSVLADHGICLSAQDSDKLIFPQSFGFETLRACLQQIAVIIEDALKKERKPVGRDPKTQQLYTETRQSLTTLNIMGNKAQDHEPCLFDPFKP